MKNNQFKTYFGEQRQATRCFKKICAVSGLALAISALPNIATARVPNIGFGSQTQGGLGGKVVKVTNLNDSGTGSLRAALAVSGPKVIVFEVAGRIWLNSDLFITTPNVTIAGETAPSPGITLANAGLRPMTHDVVVRHIRIRVGDNASGPSPGNRDGISIEGRKDGTLPVYNVLIDHCSVSWAVDENLTTWWPGVHDVTVRYSIISEGLSRSIHPSGEHSKGLMVGNRSKKVSVIGNLFAHNNDRNPVIKGDTTSVVMNNLIYDAGYFGAQLNDYEYVGPIYSNIVGNLYRPGPSTKYNSPEVIVQRAVAGSQAYLSGNLSETGVLFKTNSIDPRISSSINIGSSGTPISINNVESFVLKNAGARPLNRDAVDKRVVNDVVNRTGRIIDSQSQVGGWPTGTAYRALTPPTNPQGDDDGDGISNLAEWLNTYLTAVEGP